MKSASEAIKLIAENDLRLLVDETTPDDVWIVTLDGKHVQLLAANGNFRAALRIPNAMFETLAEKALVEKESEGLLYRLTAEAVACGQAEDCPDTGWPTR